VTIAAFVRFAEIIKAVKDHESNAGTEARGLAGAQMQLGAATDAVSAGAGQSQGADDRGVPGVADAIENVKDDLLGVKDAQLGIDESRLSRCGRRRRSSPISARRRVARSVTCSRSSPMSTSTQRAAWRAEGRARSRRARAGRRAEARAADPQLCAARSSTRRTPPTRCTTPTVKLKDDRKTEVDFARQGIAAYKPYTEATSSSPRRSGRSPPRSAR
jgi:hypothetical protein